MSFFYTYFNKKIILVIGVLISVVSAFLSFKNLAKYLYLNDGEPEKIDLIFVYAWDVRRTDYAKRVMRRHENVMLLVSDPTARHGRLIFERGWIDSSRTMVFSNIFNTFDETKVLKNVVIDENTENISIEFKGGGFNLSGRERLNVVLISSPLHMRRIKFCTRRSGLSKVSNIYLLPAPLSEYEFDNAFFARWWIYKYSPVAREFFKIVVYNLIKW